MSRLQGHKKAKTTVLPISQSSQSCLIEFDMPLKLLVLSVYDLDFRFVFSTKTFLEKIPT